MTQIEADEVPFDRLPNAAKEIQLFEYMHAPLPSAGKLVQNGCNVIFDTPTAYVITGKTKEVVCQIIMEAEMNDDKDILMTVSFNHAVSHDSMELNSRLE